VQYINHEILALVSPTALANSWREPRLLMVSWPSLRLIFGPIEQPSNASWWCYGYGRSWCGGLNVSRRAGCWASTVFEPHLKNPLVRITHPSRTSHYDTPSIFTNWMVQHSISFGNLHCSSHHIHSSSSRTNKANHDLYILQNKKNLPLLTFISILAL